MRKTTFLTVFAFLILSVSFFALNRSFNLELPRINHSKTPSFLPPTINFTFNNSGACSGTQVNFTSTVSGDGPFTYLWTFSDDGSTSTNANPSHTFNAVGCGIQNVNVTLTVTDANNESATITKQVPVLRKPNLNFYDVDAEANFSPHFDNCGNNTSDPTYTITVGNRSNGNCITSYDINWGDNTTETNVTFPLTHTYAQLGSYNMTITAHGTDCDNKITYLVKNSSNPTGAIVNPGNTVNLCTPIAPIQFAIGSWGTNPPDTNYYIDFGDGTIITYSQQQLEASTYFDAANPVNSDDFPIPHEYTESNCPDYSYTAVLYITTSCGETTLTAGPIIILKKPDVSFTNDSSGCLNMPVQFTNTSTTGYNQNCDTSAGYYWDFGDGTTSTLRDPNHTYTSPGVYTIELYAQNFCGTTDTISNTICIEPELITDFTLNTNNDCSPLAVQSTNTTDFAQSCGGETYLWEVDYTQGFCGSTTPQWSFTNGTNENSAAPSFEFITAGTYTLTLTTTNSCGDSEHTEVIEVKEPPQASINQIDDFCGSASFNPLATVSTCAPTSETVTYAWSFPGGTPATANTLDPGTVNYTAPGDYTITLEVTNSCDTVTATYDFTINPEPSITNTDVNQTICSGTDTNEIVLTSDLSGTTFSWTANAPAVVTGFLSSGSDTIPVQTIFNSGTTAEDVTYTVTPSLNGCDGAPQIFTVTVEPAPEFTTQPQPETVCLNGTITPLTVAVNGSGTPSYQWYSNTVDDTSSGTEITGETSNTYTPPNDTIGVIYYYCVVSFSSSGAGCNQIASNTARIEVVEGVQIDTEPLNTQSLCVGGELNNPLTVSHSGGTGTVSYQWYSHTTNNNTGGTAISGATDASYTPPTYTTAGTFYYYVVISLNGSGCGDITSAVSEVIVVDAPTITSQPLASQTLCQGIIPQDLEVVVSGGLGATYTYQWYSNTTNTNAGGTLISGATNSTFTTPTTNVGTLYYYCEISQTEPGCYTKSNTAEVNVNAAPNITNQPTSETICFGETFNAISVSYNNGVGTPSYQWYSNTVNNSTSGTAISGETNASFTPPSGTVGTTYYYVVITFASGGCTQITSDITEHTVNQTPSISNYNLTICSGVTFDISPDETNGDNVPSNTSYIWDTPTIAPTGSVTGASNETVGASSISQTLTNTTINPATVTYTVTPTSGNCAGTPFTVTITVNPSISVTETIANSTCYNSQSGSIDISITGGVPFTSGNLYQITWIGPNGFTSNIEDINNLEPGDYTVTINDNGGCPYSNTYTIIEPEELIFSNVYFDPETISCFGANDGNIGIDISGGTTPYTYNWTLNGTPFSTDEDLTNLGPGDYEITVTDANNCPSISQSFQIIEPAELQVALSSRVDVICYGDSTGEIYINVNGGRPNELSPGVFDYTYAWTGPNGFSSSNQNINNLFAGTYNVTVTDRSGCTDTLEIIVNQTGEITIDYTATEIKCYGDNDAVITINSITGGIAPYTVSWSNLGSGMVQDNLSPGTYVITVTDDANCVKEATIFIEEPPIFRITPTTSNVSCYGAMDGRITLNFEGGIAPITLVWDDDPTAGVERNNIGPGTYSVTITDGTPCTISETFTITEPAQLNLSANTTDALDCDIAESGAINLVVTGGSMPFTYSWSNGATTEDLSNIPPGDYSVTVTDANGCDVSGSWNINRFEPLIVDVETHTIHDCATREVNQTFEAKPSGGVPPYQIQWSSGTVSGTNNEFMSTNQNGLTIIDVTDSMGCSISYSYQVEIPVLGYPDFTQTSESFTNFGFYSKLIPIEFTNESTGDFEAVSWNFGDGTFSSDESPTHSYNNEGTYTIIQTVTYPFGCAYTKEIILTIEKGYSLMVPNTFTPNNDGINDYFVPKTKALTDMTFSIFNTWGSLIFSESGDALQGWNGTIKDYDTENGNFYYTLTAKTLYGETITKKGAFSALK
ncbi:T9SS C-terminal target domain-containing protein [Neotamlana nanhaiensis]|uniref:T9SS C-terminal target domain-containing protein n=1 Tax=Neotamlana nanhaiensis TaxID=1382798 RepID=UPI0005CBC571|nr:T9SS C-terminal target domain-containing protein [Tamlana nanhaiensis]